MVQLYAKVLPQLTAVEISEIFSRINIAAHSRYSVNPQRWLHVVSEFEREVEIKKSVAEKALAILAAIYHARPEFEEGAEVIIRLMKEWKLMVGLVTHVNADWTLFKLSSLGLDDFFDHVEVVNEDKPHKNSDDWLDSSKKVKIPVARLLGVGDNIKGDVQAAVEAGFGKVVWVDKKKGWTHYRQGKLPSGVYTVTAIAELLDLNFK